MTRTERGQSGDGLGKIKQKLCHVSGDVTS